MKTILSVKTTIVTATLLLGNSTMASCDIFPVPQASDESITAQNRRSLGELVGRRI